jgi:hypothetical protein
MTGRKKIVRWRLWRAACALFLVTAGAAVPAAAAQADPPPAPAATPATPPAQVAEKQRQALIGAGWERSADRMWTTSGDAAGLHILVAEASNGYAWRTAATLQEPGVDADQWIGNACVTGSGRRVVVVYAPRTYTNKPILFDRGGYTAIVDLITGAITRLPVRTTLAYYNPGCGTGETAALTQGGDEDLGKTRVMTVNAANGRIGRRIDVPGELTSPIPVPDGIVAADSGAIVRLRDDGTRTVTAGGRGIPFHLRADAGGGVVFLQQAADQVEVRRVARADAKVKAPGAAQLLATGRTGKIDIRSSATGRVFITGQPDKVNALPAPVARLDTAADTTVSTQGESAVTGVTQVAPAADADPLDPRRVRIQGHSLRTGKDFGFEVDPGDTLAPRSTDDPARVCAVPRNDPNTQVYQPKPKQVEWAVDMAVKDQLRITRPAQWKHNGISASYTPQGMFPQIPLEGPAGGQVPAQILLGILGQESNLWQASRNILPGETGNPLVGNYYGTPIYDSNPDNDWDIDWSKADCGYGVSQMTDGMRLKGKERPNETALPVDQQRAIATDYAANVAAALRLLETKWNMMYDRDVLANNLDPARPENWFFAIWAYNSGYHEQGEADSAGAYGLGWAQNPANPHYDPVRGPFGAIPHDFAVPQGWPYAEKVLGFATSPPSVLESPDTYVPMFRAAWWNTDEYRNKAIPAPSNFCALTNSCEWGNSYTPNYPGNGTPGTDVRGEPAGPCAHKNGNYYDLKCWWHTSLTWKMDCATSCGHEFIRYDYPQYAAEPDPGISYPPKCTLDLPGNVLVVDDVLPGVPSVSKEPCSRAASAGTFSTEFGKDGNNLESSKIDFHQVGGGYGAHFWFAHTRPQTQTKMQVTGTWTFSADQNGKWGRLLVHLPDHHALTQQAQYVIDLGDNTQTVIIRYVNQARRANNWVDLGVYQFKGAPKVRLSNLTADGTGDDDVAYDAVALQPLPGKPKNIVAILGDSYASGEGVGNYYTESDRAHGTNNWNACRRSKDAWGRQLVLPGQTEPIGTKADRWDTDLDLAFVACSGAQTKNVWNDAWGASSQPHREGGFNEAKQVASGVLTTNTTLVMLTLGGNDEGGFTNAFMDCGGLGDCATDSNFLPHYEQIVDRMIGNLRITLADIHGKADHAQIVLMGYPELLSRTVKCAGSWYFDGDEADALAKLANYVDAKQQALADELNAQGWKVAYSNPVNAFVGHGGCDSPEWINKFVSGPTTDGDFHKGDPATPFCFWDALGGACYSRASFHPKNIGMPGYAGVMRQTLDSIGYTGG